MITYILKNKQTLFLLIIEVLLSILGILAIADDVFFLVTKKEAQAEIIKIEKLKLPDPYKVTLTYFNEYENKSVTTHINDIDGLYGQKLIPKNYISIYYRAYFPKEVNFSDYKHPNIGTVTILVIFLFIMLLAIYFSWKEFKPTNITNL
jgi:hypothetical protein